MDDDVTRTYLTDWLGDVLTGTPRDLRWNLARSGVTTVNRLVRRELREIADDIKDPVARLQLHSRADRLLTRDDPR